MAYSLNIAIICGNLGRDAEVKLTPSGVHVAKISVATTERFKKQGSDTYEEETTWHNVILFRRENLAQYLVKGAMVTVQGKISNRSYTDKDGNKKYTSEIVADEIILGGNRSQQQGQGAAAAGGGWDSWGPARQAGAPPQQQQAPPQQQSYAPSPAVAQGYQQAQAGTWGGPLPAAPAPVLWGAPPTQPQQQANGNQWGPSPGTGGPFDDSDVPF